jgi:hypothetical protein
VVAVIVSVVERRRVVGRLNIKQSMDIVQQNKLGYLKILYRSVLDRELSVTRFRKLEMEREEIWT